MSAQTLWIQPETCGTLHGLFRRRVERSPNAVAYRQYDPGGQRWTDATWAQMATEVGRWQAALRREGLKPGDRVGIMLRNSREWVVAEQAALGLGLVVVPLYTNDRPRNVAFIAAETEMRVLFVDGRRQWQQLQEHSEELAGIRRIVSIGQIEAEDEPRDPRLASLHDWVFGIEAEPEWREVKPSGLATIVYTSGTTGRPKGVMLTHYNILSNVWASAQCATLLGTEERFLSFLPLSHMLERTAGYYLPMALGATVIYARSVLQLGEDLRSQRPTVLISVPRVYERIHARITSQLAKSPSWRRRLLEWAREIGWARHEWLQGRGQWSAGQLAWPLLDRLVARPVREAFGGALNYAICGGAPMPLEVGRFFLAMGVPIYQGYGMTEAGPVVSVNRPDDNIPESIGRPLPGVAVRIGEQDELQVLGPNVMLGYWRNAEATAAAFTGDRWLRTGDQARMDADGHLYITGRIKDIIVLGNGEKVPPAEMELAIQSDPLFEQVMIVGEGRPFLSALVVLEPTAWRALARELGLDPDREESLTDRLVQRALLGRVAARLETFPAHAQVRALRAFLKPWTVEEGLLTPTLKLRRAQIIKRFQAEIERLYEGRRT
ncbi:MAG TPA: long-chain fatty acid--CoA ligase [Chromatiales bacterium]|nr:long-chain fatty acid--CoA ligase [Chromatiales bacterium]